MWRCRHVSSVVIIDLGPLCYYCYILIYCFIVFRTSFLYQRSKYPIRKDPFDVLTEVTFL